MFIKLHNIVFEKSYVMLKTDVAFSLPRKFQFKVAALLTFLKSGHYRIHLWRQNEATIKLIFILQKLKIEKYS